VSSRHSNAVIGVALVLLAACQTPLTARSIVDQGIRTTHTLRQEPHRAAVCIARNMDQHSSGLDARIRAGTDPVLVEVHIRADELVALTHLLISGKGSAAVIWTTPNRAYPREDLIAAMISGC
jgi:hypothetical protein